MSNSISVYIGSSGQRLQLDPSTTGNLDAVRAWIATQANIQPRSQILLTAQGKQVRSQTLLTENELFVFDSGWLNGKKAAGSSNKDSTDSFDSDDFHPGPAPDTITSTNDLASWQNLFSVREEWAAALLEGCRVRAQQAEQLQERKAIIERSLGVAVASLQQHIKSAEKQYTSVESWAGEQLQEQQAHADNWERNLESLRNIPARPEFTRFIQPTTSAVSARRHSQQYVSTLQGFVDVVAVKQAATAARTSMNTLANKLDDMRGDLEAATRSSNELLQAVDQIHHRSQTDDSTDPTQLLEEIELVVKKMASDRAHVQSLPKTPQACAQASKMALLHTRNYLPNLNDYCGEMNELAQRSRGDRDRAAETALEHMRTLAAIESQLAKLYQNIKEVEVPEDQQQPFVVLSVVSRLPSVYGQLLVESVRRREWVAKTKRDTATLQEEMAAYQEEEEKRRKRWMRNVDDLVSADALQSRVLGIELNLQNEGGSWPMVTRDELAEYLDNLTETFGQGPVTDEIELAIRDLDKLTKRQVKHAKAFKNGSMHEAAFGDTSLLLRGHDSNKALQDANHRLEEDVRAQKSRVRKLEDLLHRQTQMSRLSTGDIFTPNSDGALSHRVSTPPIPTGTPQLYEEMVRRDSISKQRRPSMVQGPTVEEKRLTKRIVELEAELQGHKDEAASRRNTDAETQKQFEEAMSTKKDLMENMEAQQREFATERRNLEQEIREAKEKLDEAENEIERLMGSRDGLDDEIVRLKEDAAGHAARAATEHDARDSLEKKFQQAEAIRTRLEEDLQRIQDEQAQAHENEAEQLQTLAIAHAHLSPNAEAPTGLLGLASALEDLARRSAAHAKDLEEAIAFAKSENESLCSSNERQKAELTAAAEKQAELEELLRGREERLTSEEAKVNTLEQRLAEEQEQLQLLRNKFAEGETGSEVLRQRVTEEEERSSRVRGELAEAKSHITSLDVELMRLTKKHKAYHANAEATSERLEKRADRAKEVSQRLYSQNMRLVRLLERLGLVVTHEGNRMAVERASKMAASTSIIDPHMQMSRHASMTSPPPTRKSSTADDELASSDLRSLHWSEAQTADDEAAQYESFLSHISRFDLDVFADAVTKRVKDFEYTAKKYSKEAKESTKRADAYKERALKLRSEGHAKIAVRDFKEGDLALFLPTRGGQVKGAWAAFNIGCPHYFLAEREGMRLGTRDFIVARIQKVEQKVVDLSAQRAAAQLAADGRSIDEASDALSSMHVEDDNPFDLSDGLTWWMVHAVEERGAGAAPTTPGLGKSTVSTATVDAQGSIRIKRSSKTDDASKHLNKSLDSRRSSSTSKKGVPATSTAASANASATTPNAETLRQRSASQTSSLNHPTHPSTPRPPPAPAGSTGLGISSSQQQQHQDPQPQDQLRRLSHVDLPPHPGSPSAPGAGAPAGDTSRSSTNAAAVAAAALRHRQRSRSPSKSVRSLQRLITESSPAKAAVPSPTKKSGWESLWSAEFSTARSPSKEG